jgi:Skp family chaperone for outer membrane proteins
MTRLPVIGILSVLLAAPAAAQEPPPPSQTAQTPAASPAPVPFPEGALIAFVNFPVIVAQSRYGQRGGEELKKLTDERDADLAAKQQELQALDARLSTAGSTLSPEAYSALVQERTTKQRRFQFDSEGWQVRVEQRNQELLRQFEQQVLPIVEAIRAERNLLLVFSVSQSGVVAAHAGLDLSAEVIRRLDATVK